MDNDKIVIDIDTRWDDAKNKAVEYAKFIGAVVKGVASASPTALAGYGAVKAAQFASQPFRSEYSQIKGLTVQSIQEEIFNTVGGNKLRGVRRGLLAVQNARSQTMDDIGALGTQMSPQSIRNLYNANLKIESMEARGRNATESAIGGGLGASMDIITSALPFGGGISSAKNSVSNGWTFAVDKFDKAVDKLTKAFGM